MAITEVRERIAEMARHIEGVKTVHARYPRTLQRAELPCMVVVAENASYDNSLGNKIRVVTRRIILRLYVSEATENIDQRQELLAEAFIDRIADYFSARPGLEDDNLPDPSAIVQTSEVTGDGGISLTRYAGNKTALYLMTEHALEITDYQPVRYKD